MKRGLVLTLVLAAALGFITVDAWAGSATPLADDQLAVIAAGQDGPDGLLLPDLIVVVLIKQEVKDSQNAANGQNMANSQLSKVALQNNVATINSSSASISGGTTAKGYWQNTQNNNVSFSGGL